MSLVMNVRLKAGIHLKPVFTPPKIGLTEISRSRFKQYKNPTPGAIIRDGDRKRGVHASPCVVPKKLFLEKIAPPFTS